jgi:hypothetical protein
MSVGREQFSSNALAIILLCFMPTSVIKITLPDRAATDISDLEILDTITGTTLIRRFL